MRTYENRFEVVADLSNRVTINDSSIGRNVAMLLSDGTNLNIAGKLVGIETRNDVLVTFDDRADPTRLQAKTALVTAAAPSTVIEATPALVGTKVHLAYLDDAGGVDRLDGSLGGRRPGTRYTVTSVKVVPTVHLLIERGIGPVSDQVFDPDRHILVDNAVEKVSSPPIDQLYSRSASSTITPSGPRT